MSPAAKMPGALLSMKASTTTPRSTFRPACFGKVRSRTHAHAHNHEVRVEPGAIVKDDPRILDDRRLPPEVKHHAVRLVLSAHEIAQFAAQHLLQRSRLRRDHLHAQPAFDKSGRDL